MKRVFYSLLTAAMVVSMVGCKQDSNTLNAEPQAYQAPTPGQVVYTELLRDGQVIEQCVDSVVNLGDEANPAIFYLNTSHTIHGVEMRDTQTSAHGFFIPLTREKLEAFMPLYAQAQSLAAGATLSDQEKVAAYQHLAAYAQEHSMDVAQLVQLTMRDPSLLQPTLACGKLEPVKGPDQIFPSYPPVPIPIDGDPKTPGFQPFIPKGSISSTLLQAGSAASADSIQDCVIKKQNGVKFPYSIRIEDEDEHEQYEPDLYNTLDYWSYYNKNDDRYENYYGSVEKYSPTYVCRYGTKNHPMVYFQFQVKELHHSRRKGDTKEIYYIPYVKTYIDDAHTGFSMKLEGSVIYSNPRIRYTEQNQYVVFAYGEVEIHYGDQGAVQRVGRLRFTLDGLTGYQEDSWDSNE